MKYLIFILFLVSNSVFANRVDTLRIKQDLEQIVNTEKARNYRNIDILNTVADYIKQEFEKESENVKFQEFKVEGNTYKNVVCSFGPDTASRVIIGAHYDVCGNQNGADDNATGVVGLLEIARNLKNKNLKYRIDLVAYSLEEPPFFKTESMGSYFHAKSLYDNKIDVQGMVCLEMLGYFSDEKKSQKYPIGILKLFYGGKGNYITLVKKFGAGSFVRKFNRKFRKSDLILTKIFAGPKFLPGVDFSDHLNYWKFGYKALMITDTAFYRNFNYHTTEDTIDKLDLKRMSLVLESVLESIDKKLYNKLKITFLGTGTSQGVPVIACKCENCLSTDTRDKRLRSSVLVEFDDFNFVIDSGPDFRQQMLRENVEKLDAIIFTHEHKDHVAGLDDIRAFNYKLKKPMDVYAEERVENALRMEFSYVFAKEKYPGIPEMLVHTIENKPFEINRVEIVPIRAMHHKLPIFGYKISSFAYITDLNFMAEEEKNKIRNIDVLVISAIRHRKHLSHFNLEDALEFITEIKPKKAYLTHISHMLGKYEELNKALPENVELAYDGLKLEL